MAHYVIVANGHFLIHEIISEAIQNKIVIALDGAANKLARIGIIPHIILGDFDSIKEWHHWGIKESQEMPYLGNHGVHIIPACNQELTDLIKAIRYCDTQGATSITLLCATGGRLDHHEGAMMALRSEYKKHRPLLLHTEQQTLRVAIDEEILVTGEPGDLCGVIATHTGTFSSQGLVYEANGQSESICNALISSQATLRVTGSALIIMPPMLTSQRQYMQKNEVERLELQLRDAKARPL